MTSNTGLYYDDYDSLLSSLRPEERDGQNNNQHNNNNNINMANQLNNMNQSSLHNTPTSNGNNTPNNINNGYYAQGFPNFMTKTESDNMNMNMHMNINMNILPNSQQQQQQQQQQLHQPQQQQQQLQGFIPQQQQHSQNLSQQQLNQQQLQFDQVSLHSLNSNNEGYSVSSGFSPGLDLDFNDALSSNYSASNLVSPYSTGSSPDELFQTNNNNHNNNNNLTQQGGQEYYHNYLIDENEGSSNNVANNLNGNNFNMAQSMSTCTVTAPQLNLNQKNNNETINIKNEISRQIDELSNSHTNNKARQTNVNTTSSSNVHSHSHSNNHKNAKNELLNTHHNHINSTPSVSSTGTKRGKKIKSSHNLIEKKYRTNINSKIIELRNCVPSLRIVISKKLQSKSLNNNSSTSINESQDETDDMEDEDEDYYEGNGYSDDERQLDGLDPARKLNKATILTKSIEYIKHLEKKNKLLIQENINLKNYIMNTNSNNNSFNDNNDINNNNNSRGYNAMTGNSSNNNSSGFNQYDNNNSNSNPNSNSNSTDPSPNSNASNMNYNEAYSNNSQSMKNKMMMGGMAGLLGVSALSDQNSYNNNNNNQRDLFAIPMSLFEFKLPGLANNTVNVLDVLKFVLLFTFIYFNVLQPIYSYFSLTNSNEKNGNSRKISINNSKESAILSDDKKALLNLSILKTLIDDKRNLTNADDLFILSLYFNKVSKMIKFERFSQLIDEKFGQAYWNMSVEKCKESKAQGNEESKTEIIDSKLQFILENFKYTDISIKNLNYNENKSLVELISFDLFDKLINSTISNCIKLNHFLTQSNNNNNNKSKKLLEIHKKLDNFINVSNHINLIQTIPTTSFIDYPLDTTQELEIMMLKSFIVANELEFELVSEKYNALLMANAFIPEYLRISFICLKLKNELQSNSSNKDNETILNLLISLCDEVKHERKLNNFEFFALFNVFKLLNISRINQLNSLYEKIESLKIRSISGTDSQNVVTSSSSQPFLLGNSSNYYSAPNHFSLNEELNYANHTYIKINSTSTHIDSTITAQLGELETDGISKLKFKLIHVLGDLRVFVGKSDGDQLGFPVRDSLIDYFIDLIQKLNGY